MKNNIEELMMVVIEMIIGIILFITAIYYEVQLDMNGSYIIVIGTFLLLTYAIVDFITFIRETRE